MESCFWCITGKRLRMLVSSVSWKKYRIIMEWFHQKTDGSDVRQRACVEPHQSYKFHFFGEEKKTPFGMCIVQMSDMIGSAISKAGKFFYCWLLAYRLAWDIKPGFSTNIFY